MSNQSSFCRPAAPARTVDAVRRHDRRADLGEAEGLDEGLDAEAALELPTAGQAVGSGGRAAGRCRRSAGVSGCWLMKSIITPTKIGGDAVRRDAVDPPGGAELRPDDRAAAGDDHRVDRHERRVAVEERRGRQVGVLGGEPGQRDHDLGEEVELPSAASPRPWRGRWSRRCRRWRRGPAARARHRRRSAVSSSTARGLPAVLAQQLDGLVLAAGAGADDPELLDRGRARPPRPSARPSRRR